MIMEKKVPMTESSYLHLQEELRNLKQTERPAVIRAIADARVHGDLSENAEYHAAKEKQAFIEGRICELEDKISRADVIDLSKLSGTSVTFGATITMKDADTNDTSVYQIVGGDEADVRSGKLSVTSPLAKALIGKTVNDAVEVSAPAGSRAYIILKVDYQTG
jgi:transcription elongation factor GreA